MGKPIIRFKGYEDDWEQRKLGEVTEEFKSGTFIAADEIEECGEYPVYGGNGLRGYSDTYNHDGEFALIGRQGALCGNMNYSSGKAYFTEHAVAVKANEMSSTRFLYYLLGKMNLGRFSDQSAQPGLAVGKLLKLENMFPTRQEQDKIGEYFKHLDHLITLHQRKCEQTKILKKYMLQKMFPQNGEKVPEIRFAGFTDDWEQRKLGDVADIVGGGTPSTGRNEFWDGDIDWYAPAEIADQIFVDSSERKITEEGLDNSSAKMLPIGTVLFTSRAGIGKMAILRKEACTNQGFQSIVPYRDKLDSYFIFSRAYELKRYGETVGAGSTFVEVSGKQMSDMRLLMPKSIEEQKAIGRYFEKLDHLITLHQRKCDELQKIKKFMLQNMFV